MCWRKRKLLKAGLVVAGMLLLLVLMTWVPVSAARAYEGVAELAMPGTITVQTTPTEDATVTALNKEKLELEIQQLKEQNAPDFFGWLRTNASILLSTLVVVIGGLIGLWRWLGDRRDAQDKELKNQQNEREGVTIFFRARHTLMPLNPLRRSVFPAKQEKRGIPKGFHSLFLLLISKTNEPEKGLDSLAYALPEKIWSPHPGSMQELALGSGAERAVPATLPRDRS